jgi:hypothetical protein
MLIRDDSYFKLIVMYILLISFCVFVSIQILPDWIMECGILRGVRVLTSQSGNSSERSPVVGVWTNLQNGFSSNSMLLCF